MTQILKENVTAKQLLSLIPDDSFTLLAKNTNVDYQVKKLFGRNLFYLLLYGLMESNRVSLRSLEEVYKSNKFKFFFNLNKKLDVKFNTISVRLSNINIEFFENIYQLIYSKFSSLNLSKQQYGYKLTRVDSTMVCEAANKIEEGMILANQHGKKKHIKYTIALTDLLPSSVEVFSKQESISDDLTIPQLILRNIDKKVDNIFVFDRGVQSRTRFCEMDNEGFRFVTRMRKSKVEVVEKNNIPDHLIIGNLRIISDEKILLFDSHHRKHLNPFRLIRTVNESNEELMFLTNMFDLSIEQIIEIYKRRWDIEVFFRFIKQELNFKHFMSTNLNGIKIILYMTLILAMLILIFKKFNSIGYKIAMRRFYYQLEDLIIDMAVELNHNSQPTIVLRL